MFKSFLTLIFLSLSTFTWSQVITIQDLVGTWDFQSASKYKVRFNEDAYLSGKGVYMNIESWDNTWTYDSLTFDSQGKVSRVESDERTVIEKYTLGPVFGKGFQELNIGHETWVVFRITSGVIGVLQLQPDSDRNTEGRFAKAESMEIIIKRVK